MSLALINPLRHCIGPEGVIRVGGLVWEVLLGEVAREGGSENELNRSLARRHIFVFAYDFELIPRTELCAWIDLMDWIRMDRPLGLTNGTLHCFSSIVCWRRFKTEWESALHVDGTPDM